MLFLRPASWRGYGLALYLRAYARSIIARNNRNRKIKFSGDDYTEVVPPDPIPNSEVKYLKADGSAYARE